MSYGRDEQVLARPEWKGRLTARDLHALTPLFWGHLNRSGRHGQGNSGSPSDSISRFAQLKNDDA